MAGTVSMLLHNVNGRQRHGREDDKCSVFDIFSFNDGRLKNAKPSRAKTRKPLILSFGRRDGAFWRRFVPECGNLTDKLGQRQTKI